mmetsp:Transcript_23720/g.40848  ORF Transcript_23720/g.40848 Transcript_23720/m.40848 type:complete len:232 (-) Transcript_23720:961-1656(-)
MISLSFLRAAFSRSASAPCSPRASSVVSSGKKAETVELEITDVPARNLLINIDLDVYIGGSPAPTDLISTIRASRLACFVACEEEDCLKRHNMRLASTFLLFSIDCDPSCIATIIEATEQISQDRKVILIMHRGNHAQDPTSCRRLQVTLTELCLRHQSMMVNTAEDVVGEILAHKSQEKSSPMSESPQTSWAGAVSPSRRLSGLLSSQLGSFTVRNRSCAIVEGKREPDQ